MNEDKGIMKIESVLPADFDGVFRFTNWTDEDFVGKWGGKEYRFSSGTTSPMVIPEHSPLEIQHIRKKFAKDLAEREFYKSKGYSVLQKQEGTSGNRVLNSIHQAAAYTLNELTPFIQKCLEPLPVSQAFVTRQSLERVEDKLTKNDDGELNTGAVSKDKDLEALAKGKLSLEEKVFGR